MLLLLRWRNRVAAQSVFLRIRDVFAKVCQALTTSRGSTSSSAATQTLGFETSSFVVEWTRLPSCISVA